MGPHPAVAAVRHAVRAAVAGLAPGELVLVACSGGADSLALAAAAAFVTPRLGLRAGGVVVDHRLQPRSADIADDVSQVLTGLGLDPVVRTAVVVAGRADRPARSYPGPEGAARAARYGALDAAAAKTGAAAVLLGHTLDDQAETVLLGLARGAGARSLAGMASHRGRYIRPLLGLRRAQTRAACTALGLRPWDDPHNEDPSFTRVRVRQQLLPALESALGPSVAEALARTARLLRADAEVLDDLAATEAARILAPGADRAAVTGKEKGLPAVPDWPAAALAALPAAIRHRILRMAALAAGCPASALAERHVASMDSLVVGWHGQRWTDLPGGVRCQRRYDRLLFTAGGRTGRRPARSGDRPRADTTWRSEDAGGRG